MPTRGIDLTRYQETLEYSSELKKYGSRMRIEASNPLNMPAEIFLFRRTTKDPNTGLAFDEFIQVCSPDDLVTYPVGNPDYNLDFPFFRKSVIDALYPTRQKAEATWEDIQRQVADLIAEMNAMDVLSQTETVRIEA